MVTTAILTMAFVGVALLAYWLFPDVVEKWFNRFMTARQAVWGVFSILVAFVFLGTGSPTLIAMGGLIIVAATLTLVIEDPLEVMD